jgi:hypothetical protein
MKPTRFAELIRHDDDLRQAWDEFVKLRAMLGMHVRRLAADAAEARAAGEVERAEALEEILELDD